MQKRWTLSLLAAISALAMANAPLAAGAELPPYDPGVTTWLEYQQLLTSKGYQNRVPYNRDGEQTPNAENDDTVHNVYFENGIDDPASVVIVVLNRVKLPETSEVAGKSALEVQGVLQAGLLQLGSLFKADNLEMPCYPGIAATCNLDWKWKAWHPNATAKSDLRVGETVDLIVSEPAPSEDDGSSSTVLVAILLILILNTLALMLLVWKIVLAKKKDDD